MSGPQSLIDWRRYARLLEAEVTHLGGDVSAVIDEYWGRRDGNASPAASLRADRDRYRQALERYAPHVLRDLDRDALQLETEATAAGGRNDRTEQEAVMTTDAAEKYNGAEKYPTIAKWMAGEEVVEATDLSVELLEALEYVTSPVLVSARASTARAAAAAMERDVARQEASS